MNISDELQKLQALRESGALTETEFTQLKERLINGRQETSTPHIKNNWQQARSPIQDFIHTFVRSRTDSWLGGVCGGLAAKTDLPSWLWRLIFAVSIYGYGVSVMVYVMLWLFVPMDDGGNNNDSNITDKP